MYWTRNIAHADSAVQGPANTGNKGTALKYISAPNTGALYNVTILLSVTQHIILWHTWKFNSELENLADRRGGP